jgi:hypothetical protein
MLIVVINTIFNFFVNLRQIIFIQFNVFDDFENKGLSFIDNGECSKLLGQTNDGAALIKVAINTGISNISQLSSEKKKIRENIFTGVCAGPNF